MKKIRHINNDRMHQETEATLQSLDGIDHAEPSPFFYTRLMAKISKQQSSIKTTWFLLPKPVVYTLALLAFFVLNAAAIKTAWQQKQQASSTRTPTMQSFATEYDLSVSTVYDHPIITR